MKHANLSILDRLATKLVAATLVAMPFYAFLTVWGSTLVGHYTALRLVPEVVLVVLVGYAATRLTDEELRHQLASSLLVRLITAYAVLTLALGFVALLKHDVTAGAFAYGTLINLRFLAWLVVVLVTARRSDWLLHHWKPLVLWPLAIVSVFALLQFFVLPHNFLQHFGYNKASTIPPSQTINQNTQTTRAQSTLRGPNPLGAYLVLGSGLVAILYGVTKRRLKPTALLILVLIALGLSFSRSAWIGAFLSLVIVAYVLFKQGRARKLLVIAVIGFVLLAVIGFVALRHSKGVQDAVLHASQDSTAVQTSNAGHTAAFRSGVQELLAEPFGRGPGTAGPASVHNGDHGVRNSENYYLGIGQELGWAGLLLFIAISLIVALELWQRRSRPLALGLVATFIGLTFVNQLSYAWSDPTLAYLWWGLAGLALAIPPESAVREA